MDQAVQTKWEYYVEDKFDMASFKTKLTDLGDDGWELVTIVGGGSDDAGPVKTLRARRSDQSFAVFKRPKY